jgi:secreted PhoX family phosphatase
MWVTNDNYSSSSPKLSVFGITEGSTATATIPAGYPKTTNTATTGSAGFDTSVAIDANGNAWIASSGLTNTSGAYVSGYSTVDEFSSTGTLLSPGTGYFKTGWVGPREVAVDGNNNIWVTVCGYGNAPCNVATESNPSAANLGGYITMISGSSTASSYSYSTPIAASYLAGPASLAIDNAGSIWIANSGASAAQTGSSAINAYLTEIVGVAAPVAIPMVQALKNSVSNGANTVGAIGNRP